MWARAPPYILYCRASIHYLSNSVYVNCAKKQPSKCVLFAEQRPEHIATRLPVTSCLDSRTASDSLKRTYFLRVVMKTRRTNIDLFHWRQKRHWHRESNISIASNEMFGHTYGEDTTSDNIYTYRVCWIYIRIQTNENSQISGLK